MFITKVLLLPVRMVGPHQVQDAGEVHRLPVPLHHHRVQVIPAVLELDHLEATGRFKGTVQWEHLVLHLIII